MSRNVLALRAASSDQGHFLAFAAVRTRTFAEHAVVTTVKGMSSSARPRRQRHGKRRPLLPQTHPRPFYAPPAPRGPLPGLAVAPAATLASSGLRATGRDRPLAQSSVCMALKEGIGMAVRRPSWLWSRRHLGRARVKSRTTNGFLVTYYTSFTLVAELIRIKLESHRSHTLCYLSPCNVGLYHSTGRSCAVASTLHSLYTPPTTGLRRILRRGFRAHPPGPHCI